MRRMRAKGTRRRIGMQSTRTRERMWKRSRRR
jgi:hypothetical protein